MMVAKATETCWRLMIYVKAYFNGVHFLVHNESINIKNFLCFYIFGSRDSEFGSVAGRYGFRFPAEDRDFSTLQNVQKISGASETSI